VRAIEDPEVVALVRERGIALEVCPTSNLHTGVVASLDAHPLRALYEMGLHTTINTDDPGISDITLTGEYVVAMQHLDFTLDDIKRHVLNAAQAAFLPAPERDALVHSLRARLYPTEQAALLPG
jgi:adenosine deaminase